MIINKLTSKVKYSELQTGSVFLIDKEKGKTSFDVIRIIRKKINVKKVGHAGTLDPAATGLLIVCTGKKTKEIYRFQEMPKTYTGKITLGKKTPSMDSETEPSEIKSVEGISNEEIEKTRQLFLGEIEQIPPMYSAIKHKGKSLYKYARKGIEIKREPRKVQIYSFIINDINLPDISFEIKCSKGTYIRVIADDFGNALSCGGYLSELRRSQIGSYSVDEALTNSDLDNLEVVDDIKC
jgi:tRNA pseudouridine55 synthase